MGVGFIFKRCLLVAGVEKGGRNMAHYWRIAILSSIFLIFNVVGCSYIKITSPPADRSLIVTPYDLKVSHTGCGQVEPGSLRAKLIYDPTGHEEDISASFVYSGGEWTSSNYPLQLYRYKFTASADVNTGPFCIEYKKSDERAFYVLSPSCITGRVFWQWSLGDGSVREGPWSGATVQFLVSRTHAEFAGQVVGETRTDSSGNFCVDRIPLLVSLDIVVPNQTAPGEVGADSCGGRLDGIMALDAMEACAGGNCKEAGIIKVHCRVD